MRWGLATHGAADEALKTAKRGLDGEARRRLIFHGDGECQRLTARASDGFEHGFEDFSKLRELANEAKARGVAEHVRGALFELLQLSPATVAVLTGGRYEKPRANWPITKYVRGACLGPADKLAAPDQEYPLLRWEGRVTAFRRKADTTHEISFAENLKVVCGEGIRFRQDNFEAWGPANDPLPHFSRNDGRTLVNCRSSFPLPRPASPNTVTAARTTTHL